MDGVFVMISDNPLVRELEKRVAWPLIYAGPWIRLAAFFLDVIVYLPIAGLLFWLASQSRTFAVYCFIPGLLAGLWFNVCLVKHFGGTPGKLFFKIRIVCLDGSAAGYRQALQRYSVLFLLTALESASLLMATLKLPDDEFLLRGPLTPTDPMIAVTFWYQAIMMMMLAWTLSEFIIILFNKRRRSLQDYMAGTVVILNPQDRKPIKWG